jgi:ATP-dependent RNA helicase SUPV3L1/SUV3
VYGSLPPETRSTQAALFNDRNSGYDVLVASDAIGMGLNLNIKRIIFSTLEKFDGTTRRHLTEAETKQIAGRAGRFGGEYPEGLVTWYLPLPLPLPLLLARVLLVVVSRTQGGAAAFTSRTCHFCERRWRRQ